LRAIRSAMRSEAAEPAYTSHPRRLDLRSVQKVMNTLTVLASISQLPNVRGPTSSSATVPTTSSALMTVQARPERRAPTESVPRVCENLCNWRRAACPLPSESADGILQAPDAGNVAGFWHSIRGARRLSVAISCLHVSTHPAPETWPGVCVALSAPGFSLVGQPLDQTRDTLSEPDYPSGHG
jgi:hypothetical protein